MTSKTPSTTPVTETSSVSTSTLRTTAPSTTIPETTASPSTETVYTTGEITSITPCKPKCKWSEWHDVHFPSLDNKGDSETYDDIRAIICGKPANIQCRAENYPDITIDQIGQVVQCDANFGLVCKNEDQIGKFKMCFNYQIRVFCCEENINCPVTTSVLSTTPTRVTTPTISSTQTGTTEVTMTTTHCFCQIEDAVYASGEMIYNKTDKDGCNFYAICSKTCSVDRFKGPCKSTTPATTTPTTSTSIPTTTPTTTVSSTTKIECPDAKPPRKTGETWKISNCTTATCEGNNKVVIQQVKCPPIKKITCANGYPPVKVFSEDGCCYHYECECVCSGWGDPHYITFDGTYYTFLDNCTYTLVKQITPKYDNFRIDIDNYFCDAEDGLSCPQSIIVYYNFTVVVLTRELYNGVMANKIIFNNTVVKPGFQKDGISVSKLGINMVLEIPEIGATITFSGLIFSVKLPFSKFGNNTEGQCGTCTNIKSDDCRLPSGKIIPSCSQMAPHWKVDDGKKQYCAGTPTPPPGPSTPTPAPSCPPSTLCKIILSEVFEECHKVIPPQDFYKGCVFDACHMTNTSMQCSGLEIYATLCATRGVCIDWRGQTKGKCRKYCSINKYCKQSDSVLNYFFLQPGDQWKSNCQDCVCDKYTLAVQCTKRPCKPLLPVSCDDPGFVPIQSLTQEDPCCVQTECRKNPLRSSMWKILYISWGTAETSFQHLIWTLLSSYSAHLSHRDPKTFCIAFTRSRGVFCCWFCGSISKSFFLVGFVLCPIRYSLKANMMQHTCKCCQEVKTSKRQVTLSCPDGSTTDYSYIHVEQCDCAGTECVPQTTPTTPAQQQEQEQKNTDYRSHLPTLLFVCLFVVLALKGV
uniref:Mucin-5AC n=1 Tax=Chelydra serpentina TaxID=8475 RepID=A0A8C3T349_CHESE